MRDKAGQSRETGDLCVREHVGGDVVVEKREVAFVRHGRFGRGSGDACGAGESDLRKRRHTRPRAAGLASGLAGRESLGEDQQAVVEGGGG